MNWHFSDFFVRFNEWVDQEDPSGDFRFWVMAWMARIQDNPYSDATPAEMIGPPWWFARIPGAEDDSHAVVCAYLVDGDQVRCGGITTLRKPI